MSDDMTFGSDIITLTDEDGKEYELEHMDTIEHEGTTYMAFIPAEADLEAEEIDFIIMKAIDEDGEEVLVTVDDDAELDTVYELFMEHLDEMEDEEEFDGAAGHVHGPDCHHE
ncbi:hypothetical protein FACS1894202_00770 [Clostridia bacterium]|nr:hypothetical protein FACS1894202_00770 [Clostridia bacterium]